MSVQEKIPYVSYIANGSTVKFNIPFDLHNAGYLVVTVDKMIPAVGSYIVNLNDMSITFVTAPRSGAQVELYRDTKLKRDTNYQSYDNSFRPSSVNFDFDSIWQALQDQHMVDARIAARIREEIEQRRVADGLMQGQIEILNQVILSVFNDASSEYVANKLTELRSLIQAAAAAAAGANGWDSGIVADGEETQRNINDRTIQFIPTVAQLLNYKPRNDGQLVVVKSYTGLNKEGGGKFVFKLGDLTSENGVTVFNGIGGRWFRYKWKSPSIYDAGLTGNETDTSDVDIKLQALVDAATANNLSISLKGKTIKFTQLDLPSNLHIYDGTLDATSSTWHLTYGRGAMMFKTTPRGAVGVDYEGQAGYAALEETKNIKFVNVKFKAVEKMGYFYKFDGLQFINCGGEWQTRYLFKFVGGWAGTPLANDTPSSYNLINPINGRNKNILIKGGKWKGGYTDYTFASPFHFVACEEVDIIRSNVDAPLGYHIDIYNKNFRINQANYHNTNAQIVADIINGLAEPDMLAMYIGQNCYGIDVTGGNWINFGKKGLYVEVGSKIVIDGVTAEMTIPNSDTTFIDIQPNYRDNTNTFWGNCADITIRNVKSKGTKYGINTTPYQSARSIKELHILDAYIQTNTIQQGVVLRGVDTYSLINVQSTGQLFIGGNNFNGNIKGGSFYNAENYALYINDLIFGEIPKIKGTDFIVGSGAVIYNNGGASKDGKIVGGDIYANDFVGAVIANGVNAASLSVMDFEYKGDRHIIYDYTLTVAASAKTSFYYVDARFKVGWSCTANIINADVVGYLDVWANVLNGSIYITIENKSGADINALPIRIILQLFTYASRGFPN